MYFNKLKGAKGFVSLWQDGLRLRDMRNQLEVERRIKILSFWEQYGYEATKSAYSVSKRSLFRWQKALSGANGKLEALDPQSTAPKNKRKRNVSDEVKQFIIQERKDHPRLGKYKLKALLEEKGYQMSASTVGRVLFDLKEQRKLPNPRRFSLDGRTGRMYERMRKKRKKLRRPKNYPCLQTDTIVRFIDGVKRYILTGIHTENRFAFAGVYTNHSSKSAADFLNKFNLVSPLKITHVQTDNGSEFANHFELACKENNITHFHTYPRSPKMNANVERFNRTLDEDFIQPNRALLRDDVQAFNEKLADWLIWYNTIRPHYSLGQISPMRYILKTLPTRECHMWWTHTLI